MNQRYITKGSFYPRSRPWRLRYGNGNALLLLTVVTLCFITAIFMFTFNYARMLVGNNNEQRTAIEAAALACAKDLSRIVIEDANFGFIGLSDNAPIGDATKARDGYDLQVRGINSILATVRVDLIIARELGDPAMVKAAQIDYRNAMLAKDNLTKVLQTAILPNNATMYSDCFGNLVTPYEDAVAAYQANQVRIAGFSQYVPGSMQLSLGSILGGSSTNTAIPQPLQFANVPNAMQITGKYSSYVNVPYTSFDFVFAGVDDSIKLVDPGKFVIFDQSLPYTIPTIVKAEADQQFTELSSSQAHVIHSLACAQPASTIDPVPAPGKLAISFVNGPISGLSAPSDLLRDIQLKTRLANISSPVGGDYPKGGGTLTRAACCNSFGTASISQSIAVSIYDWLRRGGSKVNVRSVKYMMAQPFVTTLPANLSQMHIYEFTDDGKIKYSVQRRPASLNIDISENQLFCLGTFTAGKPVPSTYAVTVKDFVRRPGRTMGGKHAGEPPLVTLAQATYLPASAQSEATVIKVRYTAPAGESGLSEEYLGQATTIESTVRPTYLHNGLAAEIKFERICKN